MSWILNGETLKRPQEFTKKSVLIGRQNTMLDGSTKREYVRQKWIYQLTFRNLTQTQVAVLQSIYDLHKAVSFSVSDGSLTINAVDVWVDIDQRNYPTKGSEFREDLNLILEEV